MPFKNKQTSNFCSIKNLAIKTKTTSKSINANIKSKTMKTRIPALLAMTGALVLVACTIIMPIIMPILNEFLLENLHLSYEDYQSFAMVIGLLDLILTSISLCLIAVHFVFSIKKHAIPSILALAGILVMLVIFWLGEIVFDMGVYIAYPQSAYFLVSIVRSMLALLGMLLLSVYFVASFKEHKVSSVLALAGIFLYVLCSMCMMFQNSVYAVVGIENIYLISSETAYGKDNIVNRIYQFVDGE